MTTTITATRRCAHCGQTKPEDDFGWRNAQHTLRQSWCRRCLNAAPRRRNRVGRDGAEHLRNHYEVGETLCGLAADSRTVAAHFFDQEPATALPACAECARIDEQACLEADTAQHAPRGPFDPNPYRPTYLAAVERLRAVTA